MPIFLGMLVHPYSKETVQMFLRDAARLTGRGESTPE